MALDRFFVVASDLVLIEQTNWRMIAANRIIFLENKHTDDLKFCLSFLVIRPSTE